mgnify:FL=1
MRVGQVRAMPVTVERVADPIATISVGWQVEHNYTLGAVEEWPVLSDPEDGDR